MNEGRQEQASSNGKGKVVSSTSSSSSTERVGGGNNESDKRACGDTGQPLSYQTITDMECHMALFAVCQCELGNYDVCFKTLKYLQSSRPQDIKVIHNICVAEYCRSKCTKTVEFYRNMLAICGQALNVDTTEAESIDDLDQCVIFYNKAIILYHLHKVCGAIHILDKVFQLVEPLDESLGRKVCLTLVELYVSNYEPKRALGLAGYIESMLASCSSNKSSNKSQEKDEIKEANALLSLSPEEMKLRLAQCKARCYAMMKTAKPCKREVKVLMGSGIKAKQIAAFLIKSQLEYQRGNCRKAIKILNSAEWPDNLSEYFLQTGDCLQAIYNNSLGCIMYYMGKPSLGVFYIERGLKELTDACMELRKMGESDGKAAQPVHTLSLSVNYTMTYNLGMQYFQKQKYQEAFNCFTSASEHFPKNPRLWLRIADCCIQEYKKQRDEGTQHEDIIKTVVGSGIHKKIILKPSVDVSSTNVNNADCSPSLTLSYAMVALQNAFLLLLPTKPSPCEPKGDENGSSQPADEKDQNPLQDVHFHAPPCNPISETEVQNLRNAVLIASSYVSLRLGDLTMAYEYATQLLSQPKVSESHRFLAHMYAGEALVSMDKISEAVDHFSPDITGTSLKPQPPDDQATKGANKQEVQHEPVRGFPSHYPESITSARLIAQYNLALLYAMRGEWSKALKIVNEIINHKEAPPQTKGLMVYIQLCRGATDIALSFLKEKRPTFFKNT